MGMVIVLPISKAVAVRLIENAFERGEFALSPPNVPSVMWKEAAREVARKHDIKLDEPRVEAKTDQCIVRGNNGLPLGISKMTAEAREWHVNHPEWVASQHVWFDTARGC